MCRRHLFLNITAECVSRLINVAAFLLVLFTRAEADGSRLEALLAFFRMHLLHLKLHE